MLPPIQEDSNPLNSNENKASLPVNSIIRDLGKKVRSNINISDWKKFESPELNTNYARLKFLLGKDCSAKLIEEIEHLHQSCFGEEIAEKCNKKHKELSSFSGKNKEKAALFKDAGNKAFGRGNNEKALQYYTLAAAWMPIIGGSSREVSIVYANRSAALFYLSEFKLAIHDIKAAFSSGDYPIEFHFKLYERNARCLIKLDRPKEAISSAQSAMKTVEKSKFANEPDKLEKAKKIIEEVLKEANSKYNSDLGIANTIEEMNLEMKIPSLSSGPGNFLKKASKKLRMEQNENEGRFVIANERINAGEIILVENAHVSCLLPENYHKQCFQCYIPLLAPIFCSTCNLISFCSVECQEKGMSHHKYECSILDIVRKSEISIICFMALRLITQDKLDQIISLADKLENSGNEKNPSSSAQYSTDYSFLLGLVRHSDRRSRENYFQRSVMATYLVHLLNKFSNYFGENPVKVDDEKFLKVAQFMILALEFCQFNAHEIGGWDDINEKSTFLGGGLFPTLCLFNHSCNPTIVRYFVNNTVIVAAVRAIGQGEQVTENYGPVFTEKPKIERQEQLLEQYWFNCECVACNENWPLFANLSKDELTFRCMHCHSFLYKSGQDESSMGLLLQCKVCKKPTSILKNLKSLQGSDEQFKRGIELIEKNRIGMAIGCLVENLRLLDGILMPPFKDYHLCQEAMRKCYLKLGNRSNLPNTSTIAI